MVLVSVDVQISHYEIHMLNLVNALFVWMPHLDLLDHYAHLSVFDNVGNCSSTYGVLW